jgi:hypothetical protein
MDYPLTRGVAPKRTTDWSRPMSKKTIATLLGCPHSKKAQWLNQCVSMKLYRIRKSGNRVTFQIDLATIPPELREKFRVKTS